MTDDEVKLQRILDAGFDKSRLTEDGYVRVRCSQCEALVISGVACHELGCPNQVRDEDTDEVEE